MKYLLIILLVYVIIIGYYHRFKHINYPKPKTIYVHEENIKFYSDMLLEKVYGSLAKAKELILIDVFMMNRYGLINDKVPKFFSHINEKAEKIILLDPVNTLYHTVKSSTVDELKHAGFNVYFLDDDKLPDNNMIYSPLWRAFLGVFGTRGKSIIKNPFASNKTTIRSILKMPNARANHKKVVVCDDETYVMSMNLDNKSRDFKNSGIMIRSIEFADNAIEQTQHLINLSHDIEIPRLDSKYQTKDHKKGKQKASLLTGKYIKKSLIEDIKKSKDYIKISMLFISDRDIINELKKASKKGVDIEIYLDSNSNSFGRKKSGWPNQVIANELDDLGDLYFYKKTGSELHDKLILIDNRIIHCGSANLTRRSLVGTNPEAMARIELDRKYEIIDDINKYLDSLGVKRYKRRRTNPFAYLIFRFIERTGFTTF